MEQNHSKSVRVGIVDSDGSDARVFENTEKTGHIFLMFMNIYIYIYVCITSRKQL